MKLPNGDKEGIKALKYLVAILMLEWIYMCIRIAIDFKSSTPTENFVLIILAILALALLWSIASTGFRWHEATQEGIVVHYINGKTKLHKWESFCFIAVRKITVRCTATPYVVCALKPIKGTNIDWYVLRSRTVIIFEYSP